MNTDLRSIRAEEAMAKDIAWAEPHETARQAALQAEAEPHLMFLGVVSGLLGLVKTFADPQKAGTIIEDLVDILRA